MALSQLAHTEMVMLTIFGDTLALGPGSGLAWPILPSPQIVAMKSFARRGQAFIVFDTVEAATKAFEMQSFLVEGKPMRMAFARAKSDAIAKKDGSFAPRAKQPLPPKRTLPESERPQGESEAAKRARAAEEADNAAAMETEASDGAAQAAQAAQAAPFAQTQGGYPARPPPGYGHGGYGMAPPMQQAPAAPPAENPPNSMLLLTKLPDDTTDSLLTRLFNQFPGFKDVRLISVRAAAFVEYDTDAQAAEAKGKLNGFKIKPDCELHIAFAKK